jgi:hypothetical protein
VPKGHDTICERKTAADNAQDMQVSVSMALESRNLKHLTFYTVPIQIPFPLKTSLLECITMQSTRHLPGASIFRIQGYFVVLWIFTILQ